MRPLNFDENATYRQIVTATFADADGHNYTRKCVIGDYDADDDVGLDHYETMADLESADGYVDSITENEQLGDYADESNFAYAMDECD